MTLQAQSVALGTEILHSQLILPKVATLFFVHNEQYESLWNCVNRICDQYLCTPDNRDAKNIGV
jgi:hypothetical protein